MSNVDSPQTVISFCTGFGGLELGIHRAGVDIFPICYLENEAFCQANLVEKMETGEMAPAPIWADLKTFDSQPFRGMVDGFTCGYPCQPFSTAGKREGKKDPRHLWPYIRKHIRTINPRWIFAENVEGHISLGLSTVIADLEEDGYQATFGIFSAEEAGAPHQRKRVYILAKLPDADCRGREISDQREQPCEHLSFSDGEAWGTNLGNSEHDGLHGTSVGRGSKETRNRSKKRKKTSQQSSGTSGRENLSNLQGTELAHTENGRRKPSKSKRRQDSERGSTDRGRASGEGQETSEELGNSTSERSCGGSKDCNREQSEMLGSGFKSTRWPARPGQKQHDWEEPRVIPLKPELCGTNDGSKSGVDPVINRVDRLRLLGNGVVPQTAEIAWKTLWKQINEETNI